MLKPIQFGLACGILWGVLLGLCVVGTQLFSYPSADFYPWIAAIYPGFDLSWTGAILGAAYGFIDGFVGGSVFAWLYNRLAGGKP